MHSDRWIEDTLYRLTERAWGARRIKPSPGFRLQARELPRPSSPSGMAAAVERMYSHARKWAPGFEIPYNVPKVSFSPFIDSAGQYRVDSDGYLSISVSPEFCGHDAAVLAILAHEACHHILDLSRFGGSTRQETEKQTDLATFVSGFGDILLEGHSQIRQVGAGWVSVHLGYLSSDQYQMAQQWVLRAQGLIATTTAPVGTGVPPSASRLRRILHRIRSRFIGSAAVAPPSMKVSVSTSPPMTMFDPTAHARKVLLSRLGGNQAQFNRLLNHERGKHPDADENALLDAIADSLDRDRR